MRISKVKFFGCRVAFTLMEVNLAIFIMAIGVLAMVSLYPLGYRESQQSRDDVRAAAMADLVLGQLTAALSSRNIEWDEWVSSVKEAVNKTPKGWMSYMQQRGNNQLVPVRDPSSTASKVFDSLMGANKQYSRPEFSPGTGQGELKYALVAQWGKRTLAENGGIATMDDYSRVCVSFRATRRAGALMAQPLYYTEIHFQGDQENMQGGGAQQ